MIRENKIMKNLTVNAPRHERTGKNFFTCLLISLMISTILAACGGGEVEMESNPPDSMSQTLLDYGWPQIVINAMEPALKEQICRDQVTFYSAQIRWCQEDGRPVKEFFYTGYNLGEEDPLTDHEIPDYDFCLILAVGTCYQDGKLEHFLCSLNYEWHALPEDRKEDSFQVTWDPELMRAVYESVCCGWSQISKNQYKEGLGSMLAMDTPRAQVAEWATCLAEGDRWGIQGLAGSGWLQLWIPEGIEDLPADTTLRGTYMYEKKNMYVHEGQNFDVNLRLMIPPLYKDQNRK